MPFPKMLSPDDEQIVLNAFRAAIACYEDARLRMEDSGETRLAEQFKRQIGEVETLIERIECEADFTVAA